MIRVKAELHVHSTYSDGKCSVGKLLSAAVEKGIRVISITDHDTVDGSLEAVEVVRDEKLDILILPGAEISTLSGHLLVYGITKDIEPGMRMEDTCEMVRDLGGLAFLAHPFDFFRHGSVRLEDFRHVDGVEVFNAKNPFNFIARRVAERRGKPGIAGSDAHSCETLGYGVSYLTLNSSFEKLRELYSSADVVGAILQSLLRAEIGGRCIPLSRRIAEKFASRG